MKEKQRVIKGYKGKEIFLRIWDDVQAPKAVVQIIHGMVEHSGRYSEFARYLNSKGYIVYADDHRGHGETARQNDEYGYLGEDGFNAIVEDEFIITTLIKNENPNIPIFILGHSFGSFISQSYITKYSKDINGIIFSGSSMRDGIDLKLGVILLNFQKKLFSEKKEARLINKVAFLGFNKKYEDCKTKSDWLSRDSNIVNKYINDKHCVFIPTINFYYNFFRSLTFLYNQKSLDNIRKDLNILIISGDKDPVGNYGKGVKKLYEMYKKLGIRNVNLKLYENGRHEMLNEINKDEVYEHIFNYLESNKIDMKKI